jgi:hypothetical protein
MFDKFCLDRRSSIILLLGLLSIRPVNMRFGYKKVEFKITFISLFVQRFFTKITSLSIGLVFGAFDILLSYQSKLKPFFFFLKRDLSIF